MGVEILDGFSKNWHFSKEDAIINAVGVGTGALLTKIPPLTGSSIFVCCITPPEKAGASSTPSAIT